MKKVSTVPVSCAQTRTIHRLAATLAITSFFLIESAIAGSVTPELQERVRAATLEVVLRKPVKDGLTYERPLPLELVPFAERNDQFLSIGTAFATGPDTYVSAGHVMLSGVGSQFGVPALRDASGRVYEVDKVLKYSHHEDFMQFTISKAPVASSLEVNLHPTVDQRVYAVGNALGEGIVIRDGLLTSMTPEPQNGRWKQLRFSAAASPGNSGGPLLNESGEIIGLVIANSPAENLNFALPIERVLRGSNHAATFDVRESFGLVILQNSMVVELKDQFELPLSFLEFGRRYQKVMLDHYITQRAKLLANEAGNLLPNGNSSDLLASVKLAMIPTVIAQKDDLSWDVVLSAPPEETILPDGSGVWLRLILDTTMFRVRGPHTLLHTDLFDDARASMDLLLKGLKLPRIVGTQAIRITSIGPAKQDSAWGDRFDRKWRIRAWPMGFVDAYVVALMLPTPEGFAGLLKFVSSGALDVATEELKLLADYAYLSYTGTLPEWRTFLGRADYRPALFDRISVKHDYATGLQYHSDRLEMNLPGDLLKLSEDSRLQLRMTYFMDGTNLRWDVGAIYLSQDPDFKTCVALIRYPKPSDQAKKEITERWGQMLRRDGYFSPVRGHDADWKYFWMRSPASAQNKDGISAIDELDVMYELYSSADNVKLPRQIDDMQRKLVESVTVLER